MATVQEKLATVWDFGMWLLATLTGDHISGGFCGRQEERAVSKLLLPMCRMYVASIRLDFH